MSKNKRKGNGRFDPLSNFGKVLFNQPKPKDFSQEEINEWKRQIEPPKKKRT